MIWQVPPGEWAGRTAFILGGGSSLRQFDVERLRGRGPVIAINDAGLDLAPWADVLFFSDGRERWFGWNEHRLTDFTGERIVTRSANVPARDDLLCLKHDPRTALSRDPRQLAGFCSGASAINLAYLFGARLIVLLGFDMRGEHWHENHKLPNPRPNPYRDQFIPALERMAPELDRDGCIVLNATPGSALRVFPVVDIEDLLSMDVLAQKEADKYRRMWARDEYRKISPGELEAERAFSVAQMKAGESLTDFGAGTGRATNWFQARGLSVLALDFVDEALETDVPFMNTCLWDMGASVAVSDLGYCCDVMEHIPREKVDDVLLGIYEKTKRGCYFRIATRPDVCGRLIGETLHLTIEPAAWWIERLSAVWADVDVIEKSPRDLIVWVR